VMAETLEEGLNVLFGSGAAAQARTSAQDSLSALGENQPSVTAGAAPSTATAGLLREAQSHYDRAIAAQRAGNWTEYGKEIEQLGATLRALSAEKR
jgi:uncharacterized membrane protein (UPF0182 family)